MKRIELDLEHRYKNRFLGRHRLKAGRGVVTIGAARSADIRLLGEEVSAVHASIEMGQEGWLLSDMGSEQGTWIQKQPIIEQLITEATTIQIGAHTLTLTPREIEVGIFDDRRQVEAGKSGELFHQVVVRRRDVVTGTHLLKATENFVYSHGHREHQLSAPKGPDWMRSEFGDTIVMQRLVNADQVKMTSSERVAGLIDREMRGPIITAVVMMLLILGVAVILPKKPDNELVEIKPEVNRYTKILFDAKKMKKEKDQSQKLRKNIVGQAKVAQTNPKATGTPDVGGNPKAGQGAAGAKVINNIKAAGLGALIGKISKRAAQNVAVIAATGRAPDAAATGPALGLAGGASLEKAGVKGSAGGSEGKYIGGVGTIGKGGGSSAYKGVGGLAVGNVGNASVGVLEEETEVDGGLDKEIIARIIRSQLGQIRYCYERQLSANPELYGKVQVRFTIGAEGSVVSQTIGTTSLNSAMVEGCILRRVAGWQFPKPVGGTAVVVTYPFLFKSTR